MDRRTAASDQHSANQKLPALMPNIPELKARTQWLYHSGLSAPTPAIPAPPENVDVLSPNRFVRFFSSKYGPTHSLSLRSDKEGGFLIDRPGTYSPAFGMHSWTFTLPIGTFPADFRYKLLLNGVFWQKGSNREARAGEFEISLSDDDAIFGYEIKLWTGLWRPSSLITVRTSVDGEYRDVFGTFGKTMPGMWHFVLEADQYPDSFQASLVLDRRVVAIGHPVVMDHQNLYRDFYDHTIAFPAPPSAYAHPYDNFVTVETPTDQRLVRHSPRPSDKYDVIVLGSGMGGGVLADDLSDRGHRVLLIEAGGIRYPVHMNDLPSENRNPVERDRIGHYTYGCTDWFAGGATFNLGGRSVYWSALIPRMRSWEFRDVWPQSIRDYFLAADAEGKTGYDRAEELMRKQVTLGPYQDQVVEHLNALLPDFETQDLPRAVHQPNLRKSGGTVQLENVLTRSTGNFSTAGLLLDSLGQNNAAGYRNLRVALHHLVTHIEHENGKATAVVCQDLAAQAAKRYTADYVVLCCGSVESAKIAINSHLLDPNEKIGWGFGDHPAYFYQKKHELPTTGPLAWLGALDGHAKLLIRPRNATANSQAYHIEVLINPRYWDVRHEDRELEQAATAANGPTIVELKFIFDSELNEANRITCAGPGSKAHICIHPNKSRQCYKAEMVAVRNRLLQALGVPAERLTTYWENYEWSEGIKGTVHHAGGSLRCSGDHTGVVDENLKFETYDNLYCCDVSVYPSIPAANPSLTLAGLAQRLSAHLSSRLQPF